MGWPDTVWLKNKIVSKLVDVNSGLINKLSSSEGNIKTAISNSETNIKNNDNTNRDSIKTSISNSQTAIVNNSNSNKNTLATKVDNVKTVVDTTKTNVDNVKSVIDTTKTNLTSLTDKVTSLTNTVNTINTNVNNVKTEVSTVKTEVTEVKQSVGIVKASDIITDYARIPYLSDITLTMHPSPYESHDIIKYNYDIISGFTYSNSDSIIIPLFLQCKNTKVIMIKACSVSFKFSNEKIIGIVYINNHADLFTVKYDNTYQWIDIDRCIYNDGKHYSPIHDDPAYKLWNRFYNENDHTNLCGEDGKNLLKNVVINISLYDISGNLVYSESASPSTFKYVEDATFN